jgi:hypothetical protein
MKQEASRALSMDYTALYPGRQKLFLDYSILETASDSIVR